MTQYKKTVSTLHKDRDCVCSIWYLHFLGLCVSYSGHSVIFFFFFSFLLGLHLWHTEVPRLGVKIRAAAADLLHSHGNARSKPCLQPTPQLIAMLYSQPTEQDQGLNPCPHGYQSGSLLLSSQKSFE